MKKLILSAALVASIITANAQTTNRVSAYNYFKNGELVDAKKYIDLASENENTKTDTKTWMYRAQIYDAIYTSKDAAITAIDADAKTKASEAWMKLVELDTKGNYKRESTEGVSRAYSAKYNKGVDAYKKGDFTTAQQDLKAAYEINKKYNNKIDTTVYYYVGLSAEKNKSFDEAKTIYKELIAMQYGGARTYLDLENVCLQANDAAGAKEALSAGRKAYPNDKDLVKEEMYNAIKEGKTKEAIDNVNTAITAEPKNAELYYILGTLYYNMANPGDKGKAVTPADKKTYLTNSDAGLRKAIELNPTHYSALYQLGILHYNQGVNIQTEADKIKDPKLYAAEGLKAEAKFKEALPFMERAKAVGSADKNDLKGLYQNIKQIYLMTEQADKVKAIQEEMNKL
ncbi:MAG: hypothetical protein H7331_10675 [Bacteroidia bacterium]|nr:hypothetical protein [Bacteroidia bacterium]